jgi:hypothetical protein
VNESVMRKRDEESKKKIKARRGEVRFWCEQKRGKRSERLRETGHSS